VEEDGRLLAALPLAGQRVRGCLPAAGLTKNAWSPNGDLLLHPEADDGAIDALVEGLAAAPWPLVWLEEVPYDAPRWQSLLAAARRRGLEAVTRPAYLVGQVEAPADWAAYEAGWSRNHRQKMRKTLARLEREGPAQWICLDRPTPDEIEGHLRRVFAVEDRGWKGANGSSVLRTPGMLEFYCRQARWLAGQGQVAVQVLVLGGEDVAFHYEFRAKGTVFTFKVGYDDRFVGFSPGQAVMHRLVQALGKDATPPTLDFCGPLQDWTSKWATRTYPVGRVVIAPPRALSRALVAGYARWWPAARRLLARPRKAAPAEGPDEPAAPPSRQEALAAP
jgi:CelD/BcsL family acetyltransferase involved in cellulose biosynthesis